MKITASASLFYLSIFVSSLAFSNSDEITLGRCHMDSCSWSKTIKKETIKSSKQDKLIRLVLLGGESNNEPSNNEELNNPKITWSKDTHEVFVFCSTKLPSVILKDDTNYQVDIFDFSTGVPGVLESGANLYKETCYPNTHNLSDSDLVKKYNYSPLPEIDVHIKNPVDIFNYVNLDSEDLSLENGEELIEKMIHFVDKDINQSIAAKNEIENLNRIQAGDTNKARMLNKEGLTYLKNNKINDAITVFEEANKADPSDPEISNNLAFSYVNIDPYKEKENLVKTLMLDPVRVYAWYEYGRALANEGDIAKARNCFILGYFYSKNQKSNIQFLAKKIEAEHGHVKESMVSAYNYITKVFIEKVETVSIDTESNEIASNTNNTDLQSASSLLEETDAEESNIGSDKFSTSDVLENTDSSSQIKAGDKAAHSEEADKVDNSSTDLTAVLFLSAIFLGVFTLLLKYVPSLIYIIPVILFFYPLLNEETNNNCKAVESKFLSRTDPVLGVFGAILTQDSNGEFAKIYAKKKYPNLPPFISCTFTYYSIIFNNDKKINSKNTVQQ